jgi:hypothetical protein
MKHWLSEELLLKSKLNIWALRITSCPPCNNKIGRIINLFPTPHCWIPGSKDKDDQKFKVAYEGLLGKVRGINIRSASTAVDSDETVFPKFGRSLRRKSRI